VTASKQDDAAQRESAGDRQTSRSRSRDAREVWAMRALDHTRQDVRDAVRGLRKSPGFALVTIATLALGIAANTALFSIFNSLIMRPLPVRDPGSLALLMDGSWSYPVWQGDQRTRRRPVRRRLHLVGVRASTSRKAAGRARGRRLRQRRLLRRARRAGSPRPDAHTSRRQRRPAERSRRGRQPSLLAQQFGGADDVVGRQLTVLIQRQRFPLTVVGVMPPDFSGVDVGRTADVVLPFAAEPVLQGRDSALPTVGRSWLEIMVRLKPGQTIEHATAALRSVQPQIRDAVLPGLRGSPAFAARYSPIR